MHFLLFGGAQSPEAASTMSLPEDELCKDGA